MKSNRRAWVTAKTSNSNWAWVQYSLNLGWKVEEWNWIHEQWEGEAGVNRVFVEDRGVQ